MTCGMSKLSVQATEAAATGAVFLAGDVIINKVAMNEQAFKKAALSAGAEFASGTVSTMLLPAITGGGVQAAAVDRTWINPAVSAAVYVAGDAFLKFDTRDSWLMKGIHQAGASIIASYFTTPAFLAAQ